MPQASGIDTGYDPRIEERWSIIQRTAWTVMTLLVVLGLGGVFGRGPAAIASVRSPDGLVTVRDERFARFRTPSQMVVILTGGAFERQVRVALSAAAVRALAIQTIVPRPLAERSLGTETEFVFAPPGKTATPQIFITEQPGAVGIVHDASASATKRRSTFRSWCIRRWIPSSAPARPTGSSISSCASSAVAPFNKRRASSLSSYSCSAGWRCKRS